jgi:ribosomal protein L3
VDHGFRLAFLRQDYFRLTEILRVNASRGFEAVSQRLGFHLLTETHKRNANRGSGAVSRSKTPRRIAVRGCGHPRYLPVDLEFLAGPGL